MSQIKRLGMGLGALIGGAEAESAPADTAAPAAADTGNPIDLSSIRPNPFQPRGNFDEEEIRSLADSLKKQGLLQPVIVRPVSIARAG